MTRGFLARLCPCVKSSSASTSSAPPPTATTSTSTAPPPTDSTSTAPPHAAYDDTFVWSRDRDNCYGAEFSLSVVQANEQLEDHSLVETHGNNALFAGVYDGHGGAVAATYVRDNLFRNLTRMIEDTGPITEDVIRGAFAATEDGFLCLVERTFEVDQAIAHNGTCCVVGIVWDTTLYVANLGDSRAVLGSLNGANNIVAEQLTEDHNAKREEIRQELRDLHPDDPRIVFEREGIWRIKGLIQVSRAIGDAFLKRRQYRFDESVPRFHLREPIIRPVLSAVPTVLTRNLAANDQFLILASDGLWDLMTNQEAVDIVHRNPRLGIARRLVKRALSVAASKIGFDMSAPFDPKYRRGVHDDITVIVIYIDNEWPAEGTEVIVRKLSVKGFVDGSE